MAVEAVTVGTLVSRVAFHLTNSATADTTMGNEIKFALGYTLREMVRITNYAGFRVESTVSATLVGGADYKIADDVREVIYPSVRLTSPDPVPLSYLPQQYYDGSTLPLWLTSTGTPKHYTIVNRSTAGADGGALKIRLYPPPSGNFTVAYRYHGIPTAITSATADGTELDQRYPRDHVEALVLGACLRFPQYLSSEQREDFRFQHEKALREMQNQADAHDGLYYQQQPYAMNPDQQSTNYWPTSIYSGSPVW